MVKLDDVPGAILVRGWIVIRKKYVDPWNGIQGEFDCLSIHPDKSSAEWTVENMNYPNDWEVKPVALVPEPRPDDEVTK